MHVWDEPVLTTGIAGRTHFGKDAKMALGFLAGKSQFCGPTV